MTASEEPQRPLLRVVRGNPDDAELAALTAVIAAAAAAPAPSKPPQTSRWGDPAARLRQPQRPSPGAWRASAQPR